jgi:DNA-binding transcriptional LysR family regulator
MTNLGRIELRYLLALAAIGRENSFSRAADDLGFTQSAVSQQIARLERIVGKRLIDRPGGPRPVTLTHAGSVLVQHADAIVAQLSSAAADLEALASGAAGVLRIGCYQSVGVRILPRVLRQFSEAFPGVEVELTENEDDGQLLQAVESGDLDLTFVVYPLPTGPFESLELLEDPYVLVVQSESELAKRATSVSLTDVASLRLITYAQMREVHSIENRLQRPSLRKRVAFRSNDNGTILGLAAEGVGAAVVSWLSIDPFRPEVRALPIDGVAPRTVGIAWHRDRYRLPAADAFINIATAAAAREQESLRTALR